MKSIQTAFLLTWKAVIHECIWSERIQALPLGYRTRQDTESAERYWWQLFILFCHVVLQPVLLYIFLQSLTPRGSHQRKPVSVTQKNKCLSFQRSSSLRSSHSMMIIKTKWCAQHTSAMFTPQCVLWLTLSMWTPKIIYTSFHYKSHWLPGRELWGERGRKGPSSSSWWMFNHLHLLLQKKHLLHHCLSLVRTWRSNSVHLKIQLTDMYSITIVNNGAEV